MIVIQLCLLLLDSTQQSHWCSMMRRLCRDSCINHIFHIQDCLHIPSCYCKVVPLSPSSSDNNQMFCNSSFHILIHPCILHLNHNPLRPQGNNLQCHEYHMRLQYHMAPGRPCWSHILYCYCTQGPLNILSERIFWFSSCIVQFQILILTPFIIYHVGLILNFESVSSVVLIWKESVKMMW